MPTYNVRDKTTGKVTLREMRISEMEQMLRDDPNLDVVPAAVPYGDAWRMGVTKPSQGFRDVLRDIKRRNPKSTIDVR